MAWVYGGPATSCTRQVAANCTLTLPNGKVQSHGRDTQKSNAAEGLAATAVPAFHQKTLATIRKTDQDCCHLRHHPASWGFSKHLC